MTWLLVLWLMKGDGGWYRETYQMPSEQVCADQVQNLEGSVIAADDTAGYVAFCVPMVQP